MALPPGRNSIIKKIADQPKQQQTFSTMRRFSTRELTAIRGGVGTSYFKEPGKVEYPTITSR